MQLEKGRNAEYWRDITTVVEDELHKLRRLEGGACGADSRGRSSATISQSVMQSVAETLKGKTYNQLAALERQVSSHWQFSFSFSLKISQNQKKQ